AGGFRRVALRVVEIRWDGDDRARDCSLERDFRIAFQLSQNERGNFFWRKTPTARFKSQWPAILPNDSEASWQFLCRNLVAAQTDQSLDRVNCRRGLQSAHPAGGLSNERLTGFRKVNDRRREPFAICIGEQDRKARFHDADERVSGA